MSRVATQPTTQPATSHRVQVPHERIAQRAYEKWMKRGCPHGTDMQDWIEAEKELMAEMARTPSTGQRR